MSENKQRSPLFKLFRTIFKFIMFPVTWAMYVIKHPLWVVMILFLVAAGLAYYPMSKGVQLSDVPSWYMGKSKDISAEVVSAVAESDGIVPEVIKKEAKKVQKDIEEEKKEAQRVKSENYNKKIVRDAKIETTVNELKNRKGFKRKETANVSKAEDLTEDGIKVLENDVKQAGGLENLIKKEATKPAVVKTQVIEEKNMEDVKEEAVAEDTQEEDTVDGVLQIMDDEYIEKLEAKKNNKNETKENTDDSMFDLF